MTEKQRSVFRVYLAVVFNLVLLTSLFWQWFFNQFWLYDSQNRNLNPQHYEAEILARDEFSRLSDPEVATITVDEADTEFTKAPTEDCKEQNIPAYKSVYNGNYFVRVTTKGTAHVLRDWYPTFGTVVCLNFMILVALLLHLRSLSRANRAAQPRPGRYGLAGPVQILTTSE